VKSGPPPSRSSNPFYAGQVRDSRLPPAQPHIPPAAHPGRGGRPGDRELETLSRLSKLDQPAIVVREGDPDLGPIEHHRRGAHPRDQAERIEATALRQEPSKDGKPAPILSCFDAACSALLRSAPPSP